LTAWNPHPTLDSKNKWKMLIGTRLLSQISTTDLANFCPLDFIYFCLTTSSKNYNNPHPHVFRPTTILIGYRTIRDHFVIYSFALYSIAENKLNDNTDIFSFKQMIALIFKFIFGASF
jgi:hypothetical protein